MCHFYPPSQVHIEVGVALAGRGASRLRPSTRSPAWWSTSSRRVETSIWYFWGMARQFKPEDAALTASIREGQGKIFSEDLQMLEQQQRNLLAWPERKLLKLNIDAGGVQARRVLDRLLAVEKAAAQAVGATASPGPAAGAVPRAVVPIVAQASA